MFLSFNEPKGDIISAATFSCSIRQMDSLSKKDSCAENHIDFTYFFLHGATAPPPQMGQGLFITEDS
jgi:hypothetical protein